MLSMLGERRGRSGVYMRPTRGSAGGFQFKSRSLRAGPVRLEEYLVGSTLPVVASGVQMLLLCEMRRRNTRAVAAWGCDPDSGRRRGEWIKVACCILVDEQSCVYYVCSVLRSAHI